MDTLDESRIGQVEGRKIDRHVQGMPQSPPGCTVTQRRSDHPIAERADEAHVLGERDKLIGSQRAVRSVIPSHEGLDGSRLAAAHVELRLVAQLEAVLGDGGAEFLREGESVRPLLDMPVVEAITRAAALGRVHGDIGLPHERVSAGRMGREHGDPNARPSRDHASGNREWPLEGFQQATRDRLRLFLGGPREEHRELVASDPRDQVPVLDHGPESRSDLLKDEIAHRVAERVVDVLEAIEVQEHQPERLVIGRGCRHGTDQTFPE